MCSSVLSAASRACLDAEVPEFLSVRGFWLFFRLGDKLPELCPTDLPSMLECCAHALVDARPLTVRVTACKALCRQLKHISSSEAKSALLLQGGVLTSLGSLLQISSEEVLHLVLESLTAIVRICPEAIMVVHESFVPLVLQVWQRSAADPLVHLEAMDLICCAAASSGSLCRALENGFAPFLETLFANVASQEAHLVSSAMDLYGVFVKRAELPLSPHIWNCVGPLLSVALDSSDSGTLQNACDPICSLVRRAPTQISEGGILPQILRVLERLLSEEVSEDASLFVGPVITLLVSHLGHQLQPGLIAGLLCATAKCLARSERPFLQQSLIVVLARLMHESLNDVLTILSSAEVIVGAKPCTALELLLSAWMQHAHKMRSRHTRNVAFSAMVLLHRACTEGDTRLLSLQFQQPLPKQLINALLKALIYENDRHQKLKERVLKGAQAGSDDDDDDDVNTSGSDDSDGDDALLLTELIDLDEDFEDDDAGEMDTFRDIECSDPLSKLDLREHLAAYLKAQLQNSTGSLVGDEVLAKEIRAAIAIAQQGTL